MPRLDKLDLNVMIQNSSGDFIKEEIFKLASQDQNLFSTINTISFFKDAPNQVKKFTGKASGSYLSKSTCAQVAQYIGLSTLVHCLDGWVYFSRAINSLIRGDIPATIHLVYYAELRAAMSLLATKGVGVFNREHIGFDSKGKVLLNNKLTTHQFVAKSLEEITKNNSFIDEIFSDISVFGTSLESIVNSIGYNSTGFVNNIIASNLFESWSVDISLKDDQALRNESSYRPMYTRHDVTPEMLEKILDLWEALEPFGNSFFYKIDSAIAIATIKKIAKVKKHKYLNLVKKISGAIGNPRIDKILSLIDHKELWLLKSANMDKKNRRLNFMNPFPMICRALLLNRLATGQTRQFLPEAMRLPMDNWMQRTMIHLRILDPSLIPDSMDYLYEDIKDAVQDIRNSLLIGRKGFELLNLNIVDFHTVSQFERVPLWGLSK